MPSQQELTEELQQIFREEFGFDLDLSEISEIGREITDFFDVLAETNHEHIPQQNGIKNKV